MNDNNLIRIPCEIGEKHQFVLIHVSRDTKKEHPRLITLIGSEGENVYTATIENGKEISGMKWRENMQRPAQNLIDHILSSIFFNHGAIASDTAEFDFEEFSLTRTYYAVAKIKSDTLILDIKEKAGGITGKICEITLFPEEIDISLFDWCNLVIQLRKMSLDQLNRLHSTVARKDREIKKLTVTLDKMTKMKEENENVLLEKFALLLNEKKAKIRHQESRLESNLTTDLDPSLTRIAVGDQDKTVKESFERTKPLTLSKRKAPQSGEESGLESEIETNEDIEDTVVRPSDKSDEVTPEVSETESEATSEEKSLSVPTSVKKRDSELQVDMTWESSSVSAAEEVILPPKRQLPFTKKGTLLAKSKDVESTPSSESEFEHDDEL